MKKIIGIIHPFDALQTLYIYKDGDILTTVQTKIDDIPKTILNLAIAYEIDQIDLAGAKNFTKGVADKINKEYSKYNLQSKLIIKYI